MYTIPNSADTFNSRQAQPDSVDFGILAQQHQAQGVRYGLAVTQNHLGADMSVDIAVGGMVWNGLDISNAIVVTNKTIAAADVTNPRFDLVCAKNDGTLTVTTGTPAANPVFPAVPASSIVLGAVYVPANAASILTSYVIDKRCMIQAITVSPPPVSADATNDEFDDATNNSGLVNGLDTQWSWRNQAGSPSASAATATFPHQGYLTLISPNASGGTQNIEQTVSGSWTYEVCMHLGGTGSSLYAGMIAINNTGTPQGYKLGVILSASVLSVYAQKTTLPNTFVSDQLTAKTIGTTKAYFRMQYVTGTLTLTYSYSGDGISWVVLASVVATTAIDRLGLFTGNANGATEANFDYFRKVA